MKLLILLCLVVLIGAQDEPKIQCFKYDIEGFGHRPHRLVVNVWTIPGGLVKYNYVYIQTDGQARDQQGELKNADTKNEYIADKRYYSWNGPDTHPGLYNATYVTDENGCQHIIGLTGILSHALTPQLVASFLG